MASRAGGQIPQFADDTFERNGGSHVWRPYGGGVLEMVPSEIARLLVPLVDMQSSLALLDATCRRAGGQLDATDTLIHATDRILCRLVPGYSSLLPDLTAVRRKLRQRRLVGVEDWGEGP